ncbi:MAG TPA: alpha/beta fold hydrolase [Thermoanaerobaculia bacterium]|nr:alpha/beta fold hydrolase [Thermoanaerobaculia bacterium]
MSAPDASSRSDALRRALVAFRDLRGRYEELRRREAEPIAVIGVGCRFPGGAEGPEGYWRLLRDGVDAVREIPPDRWDAAELYDPDPEAPGRLYTNAGGYLSSPVDGFDAALFGIAPREAANMDPQQRLLLETVWEALEDAGEAPDRLAGSPAGVFIGISSSDYLLAMQAAGGLRNVNAWSGTGSLWSIAAGRISYLLGLKGPSFPVDTACSSSLLAVHLAMRSLRRGECRLALAGGVNLILSPYSTVTMCKLRALSPTGRCRAFDAAADGYVRGEGAGIVVLKRLGDALADGDTVHAVLRGSAVNHDGRSSGLTVPHGPSQQEVVRAALADAGVEPADVAYVEAHATGTSLGDPIEIHALAGVFAPRPPDRPLWVGSVKTNFGHLEAAAGIAGLIKVVLALEREQIPGQLHFRRLNPQAAVTGIDLRIAVELLPWPAGRRRIAGVSAFGIGGTNVHVVVEAAAARQAGEEQEAPAERPLHLLTLSAKSAAAVEELARRYAGYLREHPDLPLADAAYTANTGRAHQGVRRVVVATSTAEAALRLAERRSQGEAPGTFAGELTGREEARIAFLFAGQGAQYAGMGRSLYEAQPVFRQTLDRCNEVLRPLLGRSLAGALYGGTADPREIHDTALAQPALVALAASLVALWRSWGVEPGAVLGHSVGEVAAAWAAGMIDLEEALCFAAERGRLMQGLPAGGGMAAVFAAPEQVEAGLVHRDRVAIAALNGPRNVVLSGAAEEVGDNLARLAAGGAVTRWLPVSRAFHSPLVEPILADLEAAASRLTLRPPRLPCAANLTGGLFAAPPDGAYWRRQAREPVRFAAGLATLAELGCNVFVEIGPSGALCALGRDCLAGERISWCPSLSRRHGDWVVLLESLAGLYLAGVAIDWRGFDRGRRRFKVALPGYPFERQRHWFESAGGQAAGGGAACAAEGQQAPLWQQAPPLGELLPAPLAGHRQAARPVDAGAAPSGPGRLPPGPCSSQEVEQRLRDAVGAVLGTPPAELSSTAHLFELGLDSLMTVELLNRLKRDLGLPLYPRELYDHPTLASFGSYLARELDRRAVAPRDLPAAVATPQAQARQLPTPPAATGAVPPSVILLLSAPRSGSTLLRVMLAGHPALFSPPELHLLAFEGMRQRQAALQASYLGEGLERALLELRGVDAGLARREVGELVAANRPVAEVYRLLCELAGGRALVDKSPSYAYAATTLARAEALFGGTAKYLHLIRHPAPAIASFVRLRMETLIGAAGEAPVDVAEEVWRRSNSNLEAFLAGIQPERRLLVRYEDLVREPEMVARRICAFLGIEWDPAVLDPYHGERMTDGLTDRSLPIGDPEFLSHDRIDPGLALHVQASFLPRPLRPETLELARRFGYPLGAPAAASELARPAEREVQRSGLSLRLCEWGPSEGPVVLCLHGLLDQALIWEEIAVRLARRGLRTVAYDQRGHGRSAWVGAGCSYALQDFVVDAGAVLSELGDGPVLLAGHSFGALVAAMLAGLGQRPIAGLLLVEPPSAVRDPVDEALDSLAAMLQHAEVFPLRPACADLDSVTAQWRLRLPSLSEDFARRLAARGSEAAPGGWVGRADPRLSMRAGLGWGAAALGPEGYGALLRRVQGPACVVFGSESGLGRGEAWDYLTAAGRVGRREVPGGHHPHVDSPDRVVEIILSMRGD